MWRWLPVALLLAPVAAADPFRLEPSSIDSNQGSSFRAAAMLFCRQIRLDHDAGRSADDCVMIEPNTMEVRIGPEGDPDSWVQYLNQLWCEGNRYTIPENRFQIRTVAGGSSCSQTCERSQEDRACITKADIGRAARRGPLAWTSLGEFELLKRPRKRAPACTAGEEYAEQWRVRVLDLTPVPKRGPVPSMPLREDRVADVHVVCPDRVEMPEGGRFRAEAGTGDVCLPWQHDFVFGFCVHEPRPVER
jgi:hypothetical protein